MKTSPWPGICLLSLLLAACTTDPKPRFLGPRPLAARAQVPGKKVAAPHTQSLPSGVRVMDEVLGQGREAQHGRVVLVYYAGTLDNGHSFDQRARPRPPARLVLATGPGGVIAGMVAGISGMHEGGVRTIDIPWQLGYGDRAQGGIPARSALHFRVELVAVR